MTIRTVIADYASATWAATLVAAWWLGGATAHVRVDLAMTEVIGARMLRARAGHVPAERGDGRDLVVGIPGGGHLALTVPEDGGIERALAALEPGSGRAGSPSGGPRAATEGDLRARLTERLATDPDATVADLQQAGVAAYVARSPEGLIVDGHLSSRHYFMRMDHPVIGAGFHMCLPWLDPTRPREVWYRRAPLLGEDDDWAARTWTADGPGPGASRTAIGRSVPAR